MWSCENCGCLAIAGSITVCPMCGKEREMPKATTGGASNAYEATVPETVQEPAAETAQEDPETAEAPADPTPAEDAALALEEAQEAERKAEALHAPETPPVQYPR